MTPKAILRAFWIAPFFIAHGYSSLANASDDPHIRVQYRNTAEMPDNVMFPSFVSILAEWGQEGDRGHDHNHAALQIEKRIGMTYEEATDFLVYLLRIDREMKSAQDKFMREEVCPFDKPRPSGLAVYDRLDEFDDNHDDIGARYLSETRSRILSDEYERMLVWMSELKRNTIIIRFDHRALHEGKDPDMVRQNICSKFDTKRTSRTSQ